MKIVFLDRKTIGEDIDLTDFETLGEVVTYEMSQPEEVPERRNGWCRFPISCKVVAEK